jgi:hypothetical protein
MIEATIKSVKITPEIVRRFWEKVDVRSPDECWPWTGGVNADGYGRFRVQCQLTSAHRLAYTLVHGTIPESNTPGGSVIMHSCDNPRCVNPFHLDLGTHRTNSVDRNNKGRAASRKGESHGRAKLTSADIVKIRKQYATGGVLQRELATQYGVVQTRISRIIRRESWSHV